MSTPAFIFTTSPFEKDDVPLASLIPDRSSPNTDFFNPYKVKEEDFSKIADRNFDGVIHSASENWFQLSIARWLSTVLKSETSAIFRVKADEGFIYMLRQPKNIFKQIVGSEEARKWLEEGYLDQQPVCWFVIGYRTFVNAKLYRESRKDVEASGKGKLPISEATGDPCRLADLELSGGHKDLDEVKGATKTTGERIYAICYRKVKVAVHHKKLAAKLLRGNRWRPFATTRGAEGEIDDYMEASMDDEDDLDGCETQEGDVGQAEVFVFGIPRDFS